MWKKKLRYQILGIMNGTSMDAIDYVLCSWSPKTGDLQFIDHCSKSFPKALHQKLQNCAKGQAQVEELSLCHYELGRLYQQQLTKIREQRRWQIDLVALHGQTVFHKGGVASLQIGEPSFLAKNLGLPVLSDFRAGDIALSGQGAPLAGLFHEYLYRRHLGGKACVFQNIGGIANLSFFHGKQRQIFDTGPGNMLMDLYIRKLTNGRQKFDRAGTMAAKASPDLDLVATMYAQPYFSQKPPKSCGREEFGESFLQNYDSVLKKIGPERSLASLNYLSAWSIVSAYKKFLPRMPQEIYISGGGAKNRTLIRNIQNLAGEDLVVKPLASLGFAEQVIEAAAFAYLGACYISRKKLDLPDHTGARQKALLGKLCI